MSVWSEMASCPEVAAVLGYLAVIGGFIAFGGWLMKEAHDVDKVDRVVQGVDLEARKPKTSGRRREKSRRGAA